MFKSHSLRRPSNVLLYTVSIIASILAGGFLHDTAFAKNVPVADKHFLWSVETNQNTVYFLGSIHILKKDSYPLPEAVEQIYNCCRKLVFETDLDGMNTPDLQVKIMESGLYPEGQSLSKNISRETQGLLRKKLSRTGLPVVQFERFKPWLVAQTLASAELMRLGFDPDLGIDRYFYNRATTDRKETLFLETNEEQLRLFAGLTGHQQEILLKQVLQELDVIEAHFADMIDAWLHGNAGKLGSIMQESFKGYPDIYERFVTRRNKEWMATIQRLMDQGEDILVIVGAAHLAGEGNVIELLRKRGYAVRQK